MLGIVTEINGEATNAGIVALYCLIGFVLVILVLAVLVLILTGFSKGFGAAAKSMERKKKSKQETPVAVAPVDSSEAEDGETVAAITAALIALYDADDASGEDDPPPFIIRSIKKI